ncbi:MFS transporter [Streptomyces sp. 3MP-14]|uniref:MFS transporter n=1 Tax=Streptomyces mimosae TaxID=2586635 RepID=A0A5N6ALX5_9ACTN|nr:MULTISPECIES: MFS transporter [Streptomyces]KAB8169634.1 MFS transporter [Streptomyces mimosae]KAB8178382.1 MFS transporter [Streptomyces sp. 3MP-14]
MSTVSSSTTSPPASGAPKQGNSGIVIAIIVICQFMVGLDATVVNIALPEIHHALEFSRTSLAWVTSAYTLAFGGLLLLGGRAGDILGRRRMFVLGLVLFGGASLVGGLAGNAEMLLAMRTLQGVGAALAAPNSLALIATNVEEEHRPKAYAGVAASYAASLALGLIAGGMLTEWGSWRWVMFIAVPMALVVLVLAPKYLTEPERVPGKFDIAGAALSVGFMTALVYGLINSAEEGWSHNETVIPLVASGVLLLAFIAVEFRAEQPIMPLSIFANRNVSASFFDLMALTAVMAGTNFFVTQLLQDVFDFSAIRAGLAFLPMAAGILTAGGIASKLLQQVRSQYVVMAGCVLIFSGMLWMSQVSLDTTYANGVLGPIMLFGFGAGTAFTALTSIILSSPSEKHAGAVSSVLEVMQWVGFSLGVGILITVFGRSSSSAAEDLPADLAGDRVADYLMVEGMSAAFVASLIFAVLALIAAFILRTAKPEPPAAESATAEGQDPEGQDAEGAEPPAEAAPRS